MVIALFKGFATWGLITVPALIAGITGVLYAVNEYRPQAFGIGTSVVAGAVLPIALATLHGYRRATRDADSLVVWDET